MNVERKNERIALLKFFLFKAVLFYIVWQLLYLFLIRPDGRIDAYLTKTVIIGTTVGLNIIGFDSHNEKNIILIGDEPAVRVENQCNGLELLALFMGFIICFPGKFKPKVIYIFLGSIILFLTNILREMLLAMNYLFFRSSFEINHKYTYTIIVYFLVFLIWKHWLERYSKVAIKKNA